MKPGFDNKFITTTVFLHVFFLHEMKEIFFFYNVTLEIYSR